MKEAVNRYVRHLIDEYKPSNLTDIEIQLRNDFFNRLPELWQKYIFKTAVHRCRYFPKTAELEKIYDEFIRSKNKEVSDVNEQNDEPCLLCGDTGFCEYFRYGDKVLSLEDYFSDVQKYIGKAKKFLCTCRCNVGRSKENSNRFFRYEDLF